MPRVVTEHRGSFTPRKLCTPGPDHLPHLHSLERHRICQDKKHGVRIVALSIEFRIRELCIILVANYLFN